MHKFCLRDTCKSSISRGGFTLIELLVVIGIVAVLAAIMFPVLGKIKNQSMSTVCMSNLKTIHAGTMNYAAEHNGTIPASYVSGPTQDYWWMWVVALEGFLPIPNGLNPDSKVWNCPKALDLNKQAKGPTPIEWTYLRIKNSYPNWLLEGTASETRLSSVMNPSNQIFLIDGQLDNEIHAGARNSAATGWAFMQKTPPPLTSGSTGFIHQGAANAIFFDGHIEPLKAGNVTKAMCDNPDP